MLEGVFVEVFKTLKDPRVNRKKHFAVLAGAQCYKEIEDFCRQ